jgi:hypothetical protein
LPSDTSFKHAWQEAAVEFNFVKEKSETTLQVFEVKFKRLSSKQQTEVLSHLKKQVSISKLAKKKFI